MGCETECSMGKSTNNFRSYEHTAIGSKSIETPTKSGYFYCDLCDCVTKSKDYLDEHMKEEHHPVCFACKHSKESSSNERRNKSTWKVVANDETDEVEIKEIDRREYMQRINADKIMASSITNRKISNVDANQKTLRNDKYLSSNGTIL